MNIKRKMLAPLLALLAALSIAGCHATAPEHEGRPFVIYDTMDYVGKPKDLSADKISPAMLIYERQITRPSTDSERKAGEFDPALVQQFAEQSRQSGINVIALDIESWFGAIDGQILSGGAIAQDFSTMFKSFKRINPEAKIGNYDVPVANLNLIRFLRQDQPEEAIIAKWQQTNVRRIPAGAVSDEDRKSVV